MTCEKTLYPFQVEGVDFLSSFNPEFPKPHRCLADDMGLGKTDQGCAALLAVKARSALIVCLKINAEDSWVKTLIEYGVCKREDIQVIRTSKDKAVSPFLVINYELAIRQNVYEDLRSKTVDAVILDEGQRAKTLTSRTSQIMYSKKFGKPLIEVGTHRWVLTGTPAENGRPMEMYPMLKKMCPELLGRYVDRDMFGLRYCNGTYDDQYRGCTNVEELMTNIRPFFLSRKLREVQSQLPPVVHEDIYVDIGEMLENQSNTLPVTLRRLIGERKIPYGVEVAREMQSSGKVLIFAFHRSIVEQLVTQLDAAVIWGGQSTAERDKQKQRFTHGDTDYLVANYAAGGTALNGLQFVCNQVLFFEPDWKPEHQPLGRLERIGQLKTIFAKHLIALSDTTRTQDATMMGSKTRKKRNIVKLFTNRGIYNMSDGIIERAVAALESIAKSLVTLAVDHEKAETPKSSNATSAKESSTAKPKTEGKSDTQKTTATDAGASKADKTAKSAKVTEDDLRAAAREFITSFGSEPEEVKEGKAEIRKIWESLGFEKLDDVIKGKKIAEAVAALKAYADGETSEDASDDY